jgi:hypothetical protein
MLRNPVGDFSGLIDLWKKCPNEVILRYNRQNRPGIANSLVATASPYGVGEAVIGVAVLKKWTPRQGSPRNLGLAVAQLVKSAVICHWLQSRKGNATVTSDASQRHARPARRAPLPPQIKSSLPFSNSNPQLKPTDIIMSAIARNRMKNWEIIADNLNKAGWSWGVSDEKLIAFVELERAVCIHLLSEQC